MKPQNFLDSGGPWRLWYLGFFTNDLKLVNSIPELTLFFSTDMMYDPIINLNSLCKPDGVKFFMYCFKWSKQYFSWSISKFSSKREKTFRSVNRTLKNLEYFVVQKNLKTSHVEKHSATTGLCISAFAWFPYPLFAWLFTFRSDGDV